MEPSEPTSEDWKCPDEEMLLAFADGRLPALRRQHVAAHLAACPDCLQIIGQVAGRQTGRQETPVREATAATLAPGTSIDRYVILSGAVRGGMSEVYAAYHPGLDRKVALKLLHAQGHTDGRREARLLREAKATAKLSHPNVVTVFDAGTVGDRLFIAMEFVDGRTLAEWLAEKRRAWSEILTVFTSAARGLAAAHAAGLVHRDFKPQNVMVGRDGRVRVMDFGLVRDLQSDAFHDAPTTLLDDPTGRSDLDLTRTGELLGTPRYMAPEQFKAEPTDARTDQFSFCVALYEALYGQRPFAGNGLSKLMENVISGKLLPEPSRSAVPNWLRRALLRGLAVDRNDRWPNMVSLVDALTRDSTRTLRRWSVVAICVATAGVTLAVGWHSAGRQARLCSAGPSRLAGIWTLSSPSLDQGSRREAIRLVFIRHGGPLSTNAWSGTSALLDQFVESWLSSYREACEATNIRGEQSAEALDLRMGCLTDRLNHLRALTEVFSNADATVVENAVSATAALPAIAACGDAAALRAVVKPPSDSAAREQVDRLRERLAEFVAVRDSGQCQRAVAMADQLTRDADATNYAPLRGQVLAATGNLGEFCGDAAVALDRLRSAYAAANAGHDDETAAEAAVMVPLFAVRSGHLAIGREWVQIARGALERVGTGGVLEGWLLMEEAIVDAAELDYEAAITAVRRSLDIKNHLLGREHPDSLRSLMTEGNLLMLSHRPGDALAADQEALRIGRTVYGDQHPYYAAILINDGEALNELGRFREARLAFQQAGSIFRGRSTDRTFLSYALTGLGRSLVEEGYPADALAPLEEALTIRLETKNSADLLSETRFALARALAASGQNRQRAVTLALAARVDAGDDKVMSGKIDAWLRATR